MSTDAPPPFRCDVFPERDRVRVAPVGELDQAVVPEVMSAIRELRQSGFDHLIIDLQDVSFIDSTGLKLVLNLHTTSGAEGFRLELLPGPPNVQRVFELTATLEHLPFRTRVPVRPQAEQP
ncbi:MAG: STAS domain-containing protein [Solirubrobacteraceae bacterium]